MGAERWSSQTGERTPVAAGDRFTLITEVTYWNAFSGLT